MGLRDKIARRLDDLALKASRERAPDPAGFYPPRGGQMIPTYPRTWPGWAADGSVRGQENHDGRRDEARAKTAVVNAWVYSDIRAIANEMLPADLTVQRRNGEEMEEETAHPFELLWDRPTSDAYMSRAFVTQAWTWNMQLSGEAYLFFVPGGEGGGPREVWPIPSWMIRPEGDEQQFIKYFIFQVAPNSPRFHIDPSFICYSRLVNPFDLRRGLSPIAAAFGAIETDAAMLEWNKRFFDKENAVPSAVISVARDAQEVDYLRAREEINEFFGGTRRRSLITRAGDIDVKLLSYGHKDMDFLQGRELSRAEIDRVFLIPEGYWSKDATRANSEGAKATMIENAVYPLLLMLQEDLTLILPQWYGSDLVVTFTDIRPRNRELEIKERESEAGTKTLAELRQEDKLPELEGRYQDLWTTVPAASAREIIKTIYQLPAEQGGDQNAGDQPERAPLLNIDIEGGIIDSNERRAALGYPPIDNTAAVKRKELNAVLEIFNKAATHLPVEVAAEIAGLALPSSYKPEPPPVLTQGRQPPQLTDGQRTPENEPDDAGESPEEEGAMDEDEAAKAADLRRWERKALKAVRAGKPADVAFTSDALTEGEAAAIRERLSSAQDAAAVKAAFVPEGGTSVPALGKVAITPDDVDAGLALWDETMDGFEGLLDAEPTGGKDV